MHAHVETTSDAAASARQAMPHATSPRRTEHAPRAAGESARIAPPRPLCQPAQGGSGAVRPCRLVGAAARRWRIFKHGDCDRYRCAVNRRLRRPASAWHGRLVDIPAQTPPPPPPIQPRELKPRVGTAERGIERVVLDVMSRDEISRSNRSSSILMTQMQARSWTRTANVRELRGRAEGLTAAVRT